MGSLGVVDDAVESWSGELEGQILATTVVRANLIVSWDLVRNAGVVDKSYSGLLHALSREDDDELWVGELEEYRWYKAEMTMVDGVALYKGRVVVLVVVLAVLLRQDTV